jgi:hypothetical protein
VVARAGIWLVIAAVGAGFPACSSSTRKTTTTTSATSVVSPSTIVATSQNAKLSVLVRTANRRMEPIGVEEPGALPVQDGGAMCLEVQLERPAFVYLVWVDCLGRVLPLYPWNNQELEVTDVDQPPPRRRATDRVFSPMLGHDWTFAEGKGMETVVLLVRREALPATVKLGELLKGFAVRPLEGEDKLTVLALNDDKRTVSRLLSGKEGHIEEPAGAGEPLIGTLLALGEYFDVVQAVRFSHGK